MQAPPEATNLDLRETSRTAGGRIHMLDQRLFMQLLAFGECYDLERLGPFFVGKALWQHSGGQL